MPCSSQNPSDPAIPTVVAGLREGHVDPACHVTPGGRAGQGPGTQRSGGGSGEGQGGVHWVYSLLYSSTG